jgi:undecaprenyl-diphosphatase
MKKHYALSSLLGKKPLSAVATVRPSHASAFMFSFATFIPAWDLTLLRWINHDWTHPVLDWLMPAVSSVNAWLPLYVLAALFVLWRQRLRALPMLLALGLAFYLGDGLISKNLKSWVARPRPRHVLSDVQVRDLGPAQVECMRLLEKPVCELSRPSMNTKAPQSFPSSHTINVFSLATVIACFHRRVGLALYGLALLVAYSRVYVGAHWPSDLPPSAAIGILVGLLAARLLQWVKQKCA